MITLKQTIKLLGLEENDLVFLCHEHCEFNVSAIAVKDIRKKYDMRAIKIKRIYPYHFQYSDDREIDWELIMKG